MDFKKIVQERRSIKYFDANHKMNKDEVNELFKMTVLSPTAFNIQHWRFDVIENKELREEIKKISFNQSQVTDASLLVVISGDLDAWKKNPRKYWKNADENVQKMMESMITNFYINKKEMQRDEVMRSCSMAAMTMMLCAKNMGYDSCPMIGFDAAKVAELINLPENYTIGFMIPVGKQSQPVWERGDRLSDEKVVTYDRF